MFTKKHSFNEIYTKYKNLVLKVAYLYSGDRVMAEDIMQETFLRLYKEIDEKEHLNVKAWLCTTAKHLAINYKNQMKRKTEREISETEINYAEENNQRFNGESTEAMYFEKLSDKERGKLHERIFVHLMEKNQKWYEAVMLVCVLEYSQTDAAKKLGMSENAFYAMLHRARLWIRKVYGSEYEELNRF